MNIIFDSPVLLSICDLGVGDFLVISFLEYDSVGGDGPQMAWVIMAKMEAILLTTNAGGVIWFFWDGQNLLCKANC